jgi:hypothetical protein
MYGANGTNRTNEEKKETDEEDESGNWKLSLLLTLFSPHSRHSCLIRAIHVTLPPPGR